ncbi:peptidase inhibitor family I36 protein [Streptomyces sp. SID8499]|uniref:peptidase inhibitor family I36 protein n=1 Tax=Streptomyces sp. SID8499 TaxID=2706106 RepID=UPI001EF3CA6E|nr:peptidase inhibitor family I36 protein [Streptomyces sp. SID8499]
MHAGAVAALAFLPLSVPASATNQAAPGSATAGIDCPGGYVCIYPEINFGGQPWVRRAVGGGVKDLPSAIRDRGSSIRNNSDRTARVYEKRNYTGRWVCVTRSGGSIHDLRGYNWMRYGYRFGYGYLGAGSNPCHNRCERRANGRDGEGVSSACEPAAATVEARRLHVRTAGGAVLGIAGQKSRPPPGGVRAGALGDGGPNVLDVVVVQVDAAQASPKVLLVRAGPGRPGRLRPTASSRCREAGGPGDVPLVGCHPRVRLAAEKKTAFARPVVRVAARPGARSRRCRPPC